jgi:hypothetical protein
LAVAAADGSEYNVFPLGETPNHGVRTLLKIQLVYSHNQKEALFLHQRDGISLTP